MSWLLFHRPPVCFFAQVVSTNKCFLFSRTLKWQKKGRLQGGNNYFSAGTALMTLTFASTSITAWCEPLCIKACALALCVLVYMQYLLLLHFMCVKFHWLPPWHAVSGSPRCLSCWLHLWLDCDGWYLCSL